MSYMCMYVVDLHAMPLVYCMVFMFFWWGVRGGAGKCVIHYNMSSSCCVQLYTKLLRCVASENVCAVYVGGWVRRVQ